MDIHTLADLIVINAAVVWFTTQVVNPIITEIIISVSDRRRRAHRTRDHATWVAARVSAREAVTLKMRDAGYWDNYEMQDAMKAAGDKAVPGFRV
jgi:hypothetical protein